MIKRILVAVLLIGVAGGCIYLGGYFLFSLILTVSMLCQYEMHTIIKLEAHIRVVNYIAALMMGCVYYMNLYGGLLVLVLYFIMLCILGVLKNDFESVKAGILSFLYPQIFFVFIYAIIASPRNITDFVIIFTILASSVTDIFALFCGKLFGKHKLCETISPKKTVEGAVGGFIFGSLCAFLFGALFGGTFHIQHNLLRFLTSSMILSILSQFGDLFASIIKRHYGAKDFGNLLPGHGGVLDRVDSIIFIAPVSYLLLVI